MSHRRMEDSSTVVVLVNIYRERDEFRLKLLWTLWDLSLLCFEIFMHVIVYTELRRCGVSFASQL